MSKHSDFSYVLHCRRLETFLHSHILVWVGFAKVLVIFLENGALIQVSRYYMRRAFGPPHSVSKLERDVGCYRNGGTKKETHVANHEKRCTWKGHIHCGATNKLRGSNFMPLKRLWELFLHGWMHQWSSISLPWPQSSVDNGLHCVLLIYRSLFHCYWVSILLSVFLKWLFTIVWA